MAAASGAMQEGCQPMAHAVSNATRQGKRDKGSLPSTASPLDARGTSRQPPLPRHLMHVAPRPSPAPCLTAPRW